MPDLKTIEQLIKDKSLKYGSDPSLMVRKLPVGIPQLDEILGGGLPIGRCMSNFGAESMGKTLIAQLAVKAVQGSKYPLALYVDLASSR